MEAVSREEVRTPGLVRTLIADDDPFGRRTLALILALEARFDLVGTARDGREAVRKALELRPELVLLDHRMPGLDGIQATRRIKGFKHPPLVVLVTSDNTPDCRARAKAAGVDGFVDKGGRSAGTTAHDFPGAAGCATGTVEITVTHMQSTEAKADLSGTLQTRAGIQPRGTLRQDNSVLQKCFVCGEDAEAGGWFCQIPCEDKRILLCSPYCALSYFKTLNPPSGANGQEHVDNEECVHFAVNGD